jgi:hypothetical protein
MKLASSNFRGLKFFLLGLLLTQALYTTEAVNILSGPSFTKAANAPLAGSLALTTDVPARVSISVNDGVGVWSRDFIDYATSQSVTLLGFKPGRTNQITVTVWDRYRNAYTAAAQIAFITAPLPSSFPVINVLVSQTNRMEPGYTLFRGANNNQKVGYVTFVDNTGQVVWYSSALPTLLDARQLDNGDLFMPSSSYMSFTEVNMLGQTVHTWSTPNGWPLNFHDGVPTPHNTILYINDSGTTVANFPTSATDPNAPKQTANVLYNRIIEMSSTNGALLNNWSPIAMLDPLRISYLTYSIHAPLGWDSEHANAVIEDPRDNSIIVSMRHQNAVIKFTRTGQLKWILGPHENWGPSFQQYLLTPVGTPFAWNYAQHAPMITPQGTLLIYDDGNFRASPFDAYVADSANYSRAVEYDINEQTMEVSQVWEYGTNIAEPLFTPTVGNADWMPNTGNVLITFGNTTFVNHARPSSHSTNAAMVRIKEVTHEQPAEVVFDLALFDYNNVTTNYLGCIAYRSHRMPDLYAHPAKAVTDLSIKDDGGVPHLQFSGDRFRTYVVEESLDLNNWTEIGDVEAEDGGNYDWVDANPENAPARYYRVATR